MTKNKAFNKWATIVYITLFVLTIIAELSLGMYF